jgi:hypothetical protein
MGLLRNEWVVFLVLAAVEGCGLLRWLQADANGKSLLTEAGDYNSPRSFMVIFRLVFQTWR